MPFPFVPISLLSGVIGMYQNLIIKLWQIYLYYMNNTAFYYRIIEGKCRLLLEATTDVRYIIYIIYIYILFRVLSSANVDQLSGQQNMLLGLQRRMCGMRDCMNDKCGGHGGRVG